MNLEKLRKAAELMREALAELDPSTEHQGASGGCGADESQTVLRSTFANGEYMIAGVNHCPASDKWNCKYCRQVATCEENRRAVMQATANRMVRLEGPRTTGADCGRALPGWGCRPLPGWICG